MWKIHMQKVFYIGMNMKEQKDNSKEVSDNANQNNDEKKKIITGILNLLEIKIQNVKKEQQILSELNNLEESAKNLINLLKNIKNNP